VYSVFTKNLPKIAELMFCRELDTIQKMEQYLEEITLLRKIWDMSITLNIQWRNEVNIIVHLRSEFLENFLMFNLKKKQSELTSSMNKDVLNSSKPSSNFKSDPKPQKNTGQALTKTKSKQDIN
jgi:hypothetical protein